MLRGWLESNELTGGATERALPHDRPLAAVGDETQQQRFHPGPASTPQEQVEIALDRSEVLVGERPREPVDGRDLCAAVATVHALTLDLTGPGGNDEPLTIPADASG